MNKSLKFGSWLEHKLPCGRTTRFSKKDIWAKEIFPLWRWSGGYTKVCRYIKTEYGRAKEEYYLHRLVTKVTPGFEVDHINRDKLDNRRENLRLCSRGENAQNKEKAKFCTSKYRGVAFSRKRKTRPWRAYISKSGKRFDMGWFNTEKEAAEKYDAKAKELWGEFAFQNFNGE